MREVSIWINKVMKKIGLGFLAAFAIILAGCGAPLNATLTVENNTDKEYRDSVKTLKAKMTVQTITPLRLLLTDFSLG